MEIKGDLTVKRDLQVYSSNLMFKNLPATYKTIYCSVNGGNDTTGDGTVGRPFLTIAKALSIITAPFDQDHHWVIRLAPGRYQEAVDLVFPPYVDLIGEGHRSTYVIVNSITHAVKPSADWATSSSWTTFKGIYFGGSTVLNFDLQALGGSNANIVIQDCWTNVTNTFKGRNAGGGDFLEVYDWLSIGGLNLDMIHHQIQGMLVSGDLSIDNTLASCDGSFVNCNLNGNVAINSTAGNAQNISLSLSSFATTTNTLTTSNGLAGTVVLTVDSLSMPPVTRQSISSGTTINYVNDASALKYVPTTPTNWWTVPNQVNMALDQLRSDFVNQNAILLDPTGFSFPENIIVNYNSTTRIVTLTGTVNAYFQGKKVAALTSGWSSTAHTNTAPATYWLSYDGSAFNWTTSFPGFDKLLICLVSFGTTDKFALRECHGLMGWESHREAHLALGAFRNGGGDLSGYTLASTVATNRRPITSALTIYDEDLQTINPIHNSTNYQKFFLSGTQAAPVSNYTGETAEIIPFLINRPYYNRLTGGNWVQTLMPNNTYQCLWQVAIPVTSDATSQAYRFVWIQGQTQGNLASQQALTTGSVTIGNLVNEVSEIIFINRVIINYNGTSWSITQIDTITGTRFNSITTNSQGITSVSTDASITGGGTAANPLSSGFNPLTTTSATETISTTQKLYFIDSSVTSTIQLPAANTLQTNTKLQTITLKMINWSQNVRVLTAGADRFTDLTSGSQDFYLTQNQQVVTLTATSTGIWYLL